MFVSNIEDLVGFFFGIFVFFFGVIVINFDFENGMIRVVFSKLVRRIGYFGGKFLVYVVVFFVVFFLMMVIGIIGFVWMGVLFG